MKIPRNIQRYSQQSNTNAPERPPKPSPRKPSAIDGEEYFFNSNQQQSYSPHSRSYLTTINDNNNESTSKTVEEMRNALARSASKNFAESQRQQIRNKLLNSFSNDNTDSNDYQNENQNEDDENSSYKNALRAFQEKAKLGSQSPLQSSPIYQHTQYSVRHN
jgi:hypothetical protein